MSKYILITGSPRKGANSDKIAEFVKDSLGDNEVEIWNIYEKEFTYCHADNACKEADKCVIDDDASKLTEDLIEADGAFLIAPIYFGRLPGPVLTLIDRFYGKFNPAKGFAAPSPDKKLGVVLTLGGDEEAVKAAAPVAESTAFAFSLLGFGASKSAVLGDNNIPAIFESKDDQKAEVQAVVDWIL